MVMLEGVRVYTRLKIDWEHAKTLVEFLFPLSPFLLFFAPQPPPPLIYSIPSRSFTQMPPQIPALPAQVNTPLPVTFPASMILDLDLGSLIQIDTLHFLFSFLFRIPTTACLSSTCSSFALTAYSLAWVQVSNCGSDRAADYSSLFILWSLCL